MLMICSNELNNLMSLHDKSGVKIYSLALLWKSMVITLLRSSIYLTNVLNYLKFWLLRLKQYRNHRTSWTIWLLLLFIFACKFIVTFSTVNTFCQNFLQTIIIRFSFCNFLLESNINKFSSSLIVNILAL